MPLPAVGPDYRRPDTPWRLPTTSLPAILPAVAIASRRMVARFRRPVGSLRRRGPDGNRVYARCAVTSVHSGEARSSFLPMVVPWVATRSDSETTTNRFPTALPLPTLPLTFVVIELFGGCGGSRSARANFLALRTSKATLSPFRGNASAYFALAAIMRGADCDRTLALQRNASARGARRDAGVRSFCGLQARLVESP